jgi:lysozyme
MTKNEIKNLQAKLAMLGFSPGPIDGWFGTLTYRAILAALDTIQPAPEPRLMAINDAGVALIKDFEKCRLRAYQDSGGVWTVGWGLTSRAGVITVGPNTAITQEQADDYFAQALAQYERGVQAALTRRPTSNQFSAMVSLCYNIGVDAFRDSSIDDYFNRGDDAGCADRFLLWVKDNGQILEGLQHRRAAERELFLKL